MRIMIDPGHGGKDPGAVLGTRTEKADVLNLALKVGEILSGKMDVKYTRTSDVFDSLGQKAAIANNANADYFCSIHRNALGAEANGVEVFVYDTSGANYQIASKICEKLTAIGFRNRGVKVDKGLAVLNSTRMPALLVEVGFITNAGDNTIFDNRFEEIARAIAGAYTEVLGLGNIDNISNILQSVKYRAHVQNLGWLEWVMNGQTAGTEGRSLRLEGLEAMLEGFPPEVYLECCAHIQDIGWTGWYSNGQFVFAGTESESKRLEALRLRLVNAPGYRVKYRVHVQDIGWLDWVYDGQTAGTEGQSKRIEAVQIIIEKI